MRHHFDQSDDDATLVLVNIGMQTFTYAEYQSLALAKVWTQTAFLPNEEELWRRQNERVARKGGYGKYFQFLGSEGTDGTKYH